MSPACVHSTYVVADRQEGDSTVSWRAVTVGEVLWTPGTRRTCGRMACRMRACTRRGWRVCVCRVRKALDEGQDMSKVNREVASDTCHKLCLPQVSVCGMLVKIPVCGLLSNMEVQRFVYR